jgi:hypothetical protein
MKVPLGLRVRVHRHDPGGWYMIAPPSGSFSWIRVEHVRQTGAGEGELIADNVIARVGSAFSDVRDVEQRRLSTGDRVEILDRKTFNVDGRSIAMYKIKPPRNEYRWISGQYVARPDQIAARRRSSNSGSRNGFSRNGTSRSDGRPPFDSGPQAYVVDDAPREPSRNGIRERPLVRTTEGDAVRRRLPAQSRIEADRRKLRAIDDRFRSELRKNTGEWNLTSLGPDYRQLQRTAALPAMEGQIDLRLAAVERYSAIKKEYDEFITLTQETDLRDAKLTAMGRALKPVVEPPRQPAPTQPRQAPTPPTSPRITPTKPGPIATTDGSGRPPIPSQPVDTRQPRKYAGAGIVQRSATTFRSAPRYVLLAPSGRILAYLQAEDGVNLDQAIGRAMGITGSRSYRADLQTDFIRVRNLTPIRLRP